MDNKTPTNGSSGLTTYHNDAPAERELPLINDARVALEWNAYLYDRNFIDEYQYWKNWRSFTTLPLPADRYSRINQTLKWFPKEYMKWLTKRRLKGLPTGPNRSAS